MGWERKRGKLEEWNAILRGATDTSFSVQVGDVAVLPSVRYCLTLDSDTRLPRDAAKKLVGILAHPLNRPRFDPRLGRVTEGYGILQPRVSVTMASAAGSLFARLYAGHTGVDPYTTAVSDTYQDLFQEGIFTGKGLYDVDAFTAALEGRVPENALLSHDLFEGLYARTALVTDVEVVDDYPASVLVHARRRHRWVRGDWQILRWLFPWVPSRSGLARNRLPLISRWKIFDNLRRSLVAPATVAFLLLAWALLPGRPAVWTAAILAGLAFPLYPLLLGTALRPRAQQPWRVFLRAAWEDGKTALAQVSLQLTFLASQAYESAHAIVLTLVRLGATQRRMLEWETAAASAARAAGPARRTGVRLFLVEMIASPVIALASLLLLAALRPGALVTALPILALWAAAPFVAHALSRPVVRPSVELGEEDRRVPPPPGPQHVAILRDVHGPGAPRPASGQLPGDTHAPGGPPDLAHEHRHGAARDARRPRSRLHRDGRARLPDRRHPHHDGRPRALRRSPAQLVRHEEPGSASAGLRVHRRQRQPRGRAHGPGGGAAPGTASPTSRAAPPRSRTG